MEKRERVTIGHIWGGIYPVILYLFITMVAAFILLYIKHMIVISNDSVNIQTINDNLSLIITFFGALITAPLLILIKYLDTRKQKMMGGYGYKSVFFAKYLFIIPFAVTFMYAANVFVNILEIIIPSIAHSYDSTSKAIYGADISIQIVTAVILGPIVEELMFRGLMYIRFKRMFGAGASAFVTSLLFGIYHMNIAQGIYAFLFSYAAIFVYERYKKIYAPIIFHMVSNGVSVLVTFVFKDYNTSESVKNNLDAKTQIVSLIIICAISASLCALFALFIKKWVDPRKK